MPQNRSIKTKIGVVGTINRDTIYRHDGTDVESWGGLLYSIKNLCDESVGIIIPAVNLGRDAYKPVMSILNRFRRIDLSHIRKVPEKNNHCFLHYHNQSHKCEILKGGVPSLTYRRLRPLNDCDIVVVNFISGRDVTLAALEKFRAEFAGLVYMDIHSHTLGRRKVEGGHRRHLRRPPHWRRYIACADILQVNAVEFELLSGKKISRAAVGDFFAREAQHLKCLIVTLGVDGSLVSYRGKGNAIITRSIPVVSIERVHDTTGCGDIFGAGFVAEYLRTRSPIKAARHGSRKAGARCCRKGRIF
jgi:sugar/nucleoside kinase (ribokinase family)